MIIVESDNRIKYIMETIKNDSFLYYNLVEQARHQFITLLREDSNLYLTLDLEDNSLVVQSTYIKTILGKYLYLIPLSRKENFYDQLGSKEDFISKVKQGLNDSTKTLINNDYRLSDYIISKCSFNELSIENKIKTYDYISTSLFRATESEVKILKSFGGYQK